MAADTRNEVTPGLPPGLTVPPQAGAVLLVDVAAVVANWLELRARTAPAEIAGVVKADGYGLGADRVAPALAAAGCRLFFTAHPDEALDLRPLLPADATLAVLNGLAPGTEELFLAGRIVPVLNQLDEVARWQAMARARTYALPAFIHIDTGMNRLGLSPGELDVLAAEPDRLDGIRVKGWISHLACADSPDDDPVSGGLTLAQRDRFRAALARLPAAPASLANSAGIFRGRDLHFDIVRPGCAVYGINPVPGLPNPMRQTVRLLARILQVRDVDSPMTVGYGATHRVARRGRIATISVGYADGYSRSLSARGHVFAGGLAAPVVGRVSMDLMTVDITGLPPDLTAPGGFVELIGPQRPVDQVAAEAGTIGYEILTGLGRRYCRLYHGTAEDEPGQPWHS
jgi:alanine racemase